jgi:hypothetical protein
VVFEVGAVEDVSAGPGPVEELVRKAEVDRAGLLQRGALVLGEGHVEGAEVVFELRQRAGSDNRGGDRGVEQRPGQRHLGRRAADLGRDVADHLSDGQPALTEYPCCRGQVLAGLLAIGVIEVSAGVFAGEYAFGERRPREHAQAHLARHRDQVAFGGPLDQAVFDLQRDQRRPAAQFGDRLVS